MKTFRMLIHDERDIDRLTSVLYKTPEKIGIQVHSNNHTVIIMDEKTFQCEMQIAVVSKEVYMPVHAIESLKQYVMGYYAGLKQGEVKIKNQFKAMFDIMG